MPKKRTLVSSRELCQYKWRDAPSDGPVVLLTGKLLEDYPEYSDIFRIFRVSNLPLYTYTADAAKTLGRMFEAKLSFHHRDRMAAEVRTFAGNRAPVSQRLEGYMNLYGPDLSKSFIAISTHPDDPDIADKSTILHEYGHYVEQRKAALLGATHALQMRETSFLVAYQLLRHGCPNISDRVVLRAADELVAQINSLWLCWVLGLDTGLVLAGMILGEVSHPSAVTTFSTTHLPRLSKYFINRRIAEAWFKSFYGFGFKDFADDGDEKRMCFQIDDATRRLLNSL